MEEESGKAKRCGGHADEGVVNVGSKMRTPRLHQVGIVRCGGNNKLDVCRRHAKEGMINLQNKACTQNG